MASAKTIGVLYPGEMGASLAVLLGRRGHAVVASGAGRGRSAARLCRDAGVKLPGERPGRASAMKMLLSGLSKGVCGLFVETALVAERQGMLAEMTEAYAQIYPGIMAVVERMLPTYPQHAGRRAAEMAELEQTALAAGLEPCVLAAVARVHEMLAG